MDPIGWTGIAIQQVFSANALEPNAYLRHVFTELPKAQSLAEAEALLPTRLDPASLTRHSLQGPFINPRH